MPDCSALSYAGAFATGIGLAVRGFLVHHTAGFQGLKPRRPSQQQYILLIVKGLWTSFVTLQTIEQKRSKAEIRSKPFFLR